MVKFVPNNRIDDLLNQIRNEGVLEASDFSFIAVVYNEILNLSDIEIELMEKNYGINSPIVPLIEISKANNIDLHDIILIGTDALNKVKAALKRKYAK